MYLRRFWRRCRSFRRRRRVAIDSVPVLLPGALLRTRRRRDSLAGVPVTWVTPRAGPEPRLVLLRPWRGLHRRLVAHAARSPRRGWRWRAARGSSRWTTAWRPSIHGRRRWTTCAPCGEQPLPSTRRGRSSSRATRQEGTSSWRFSDRAARLGRGAPCRGGAVLSVGGPSPAPRPPSDQRRRGRGGPRVAARGGRRVRGGTRSDPSRRCRPLRAEPGRVAAAVRAGRRRRAAPRRRRGLVAAKARAAGVRATLDVLGRPGPRLPGVRCAVRAISLDAIARAGEAVQVFAPVPKMARI